MSWWEILPFLTGSVNAATSLQDAASSRNDRAAWVGLMVDGEVVAFVLVETSATSQQPAAGQKNKRSNFRLTCDLFWTRHRSRLV